ncbi:tetratricopeptide repeat protein [Gimesia aquarii]|uniref:Tetratricopeptide repeat protein n=1 Tax=Gimesia aquarii TaxID=2527964 RepID=A0A517X2E3_9PLAN|nr:hypothetical protein [Gimesia aquarii]QDU11662.1 hypothetical protein V202x_50860 [Gimesia aquarii]
MMDHYLKRIVFRQISLNLTILTVCLCLQQNVMAQTNGNRNSQPMTPTELQAFGKQIQQTVRSQDAVKFRELFDWQTFINRTLAEFEQNPAVQQSMKPIRQQLQATYDGTNQGIDSELLAEIANGADYRFLTMRKEQNQYKVIFRFLRPDWSLDYHALIIEKHQSGNLKIIDIDSFSTGELLSQTIKWSLIPEIQKAQLNVQNKLNAEEKSRIQEQKKLYDFLNLSSGKGDPFQAYQQLSKQYKGRKTVLLRLAQDTIEKENHKKYLQVLNVFRKYHPGDSTAELLSIDYFVLMGDYASALECLDRLNASIKIVDPYLYSLRAGILIEMGDIVLAGKYAGKASEIEPNLLQPYMHLINISVMQSNFDQTIKYLDILKSKFGFSYEDLDLSELDNYTKFTNSTQFKKWKANQK